MNEECKWHEEAMPYRLFVAVGAGAHARMDKAAEIELDLAVELRTLGWSGRVEDLTVAAVEMDASGDVLGRLPCQYDAPSGGVPGTLVLQLPGFTPAGAKRQIAVYAGSRSASLSPMPGKLAVSELNVHGSPHWRIKTPAAVYVFDQTGGALSEMCDPDGLDWVQFDNSGPPIEYRGIPNLQIYKGREHTGVFHPGYGTVRCAMIGQGPVRARILCRTEVGGEWICTWDFYAAYAVCTVWRGNRDGFAFLYEGVPGGRDFAYEKLFVCEPDGRRTYFLPSPGKPYWARDLSPEWVYFGDERASRVLFYAHHEDDEVQEAAYEAYEELTVFGFGRDAEPGINEYPAHFTVGFCESVHHEEIERQVRAAYQPLDIRRGDWEMRR